MGRSDRMRETGPERESATPVVGEAVCIACGKRVKQGQLIATSVGYKCRACAKPISKLRKPFKHPVLTTLLAEDGFTFISRPLSLALGTGMLVGALGRSLDLSASWLAVGAAVLLGLGIGEVTRLGVGKRPLRLHAVVAMLGVVAAAAVAHLPFAPMAIGALIAAAWLLVPADFARR